MFDNRWTIVLLCLQSWVSYQNYSQTSCASGVSGCLTRQSCVEHEPSVEPVNQQAVQLIYWWPVIQPETLRICLKHTCICTLPTSLGNGVTILSLKQGRDMHYPLWPHVHVHVCDHVRKTNHMWWKFFLWFSIIQCLWYFCSKFEANRPNMI